METSQEITILHEWPRWLKLKQAAAYAAMGKNRLIALAREKKIRGVKDPDSGRKEWIFEKDSIDRYRENQMPADEIRQKVLEYMERDAY